MERRNFIKKCCFTAVGVPLSSGILQSCGSIYYAQSTLTNNVLSVKKSEFWSIVKEKKKNRTFVILTTETESFPICLYKVENNNYVASLLRCTHQGCELNVGGGIYSCPCHGSEFSNTGKVLEGPAQDNLKTYIIKTDNENIHISLS